MIKKNWIYILFGLSVIIFTISQFKNDKKNPEIIAKTVYLGNGWGAKILVDGKLYITMNRIPAIEGNKPFVSEQQAMKTAIFAIFKMKMKESLPDISIKELDSLGIEK